MPLAPRTLAVTVGRPAAAGAPLNSPIVLATNFRAASDYSRDDGTDTWRAFEAALGALEGGSALAYASGMAAAHAALHALAPRVLVLPTVCYMGVRGLVAQLVSRGGLEVRSVDITDPDAVVAAAAGADVVWIETPTNPTLDVADLPRICAAARAAGARTVVDSTFATPLGLKPLAEGADIVMHSATKFIGGHSDLLLGALITNDAGLLTKLQEARTYAGATPGGLETFLALRGLRTLPLRFEASQASARALAPRLAAHAAVERVRYPGSGAMLAIEVRGGAPAADAVCAAVRLVVPATSLGGVESSIERRAKYPGDAHVAPGLLRMSVGIEDVDDIWGDLKAALDAQLAAL